MWWWEVLWWCSVAGCLDVETPDMDEVGRRLQKMHLQLIEIYSNQTIKDVSNDREEIFNGVSMDKYNEV